MAVDAAANPLHEPYVILRETAVDTITIHKAIQDSSKNKNDAAFELYKRLLILQYNSASKEVDEHVKELDVWKQNNPVQAGTITNTLSHVENNWRSIKGTWDFYSESSPETNLTAQNISDLESKSSKNIANVIEHCALFTIPSDVARRLGKMNNGERIDFRNDYGDEVINDEQIKTVYNHTKSASKLFDAVFDDNSLTAMKVDRSLMGLLPAFLGMLLALAVPALIFWLARSQFPDLLPSSLRAIENKKFYGLAIVAFAGGLGHFAIDVFKARNVDMATKPAEYIDWFRAYWMKAAIASLVVWAAYFIYMGLQGADTISQVAAVTVLLVGYTADSIVDAGLKRFLVFAKPVSAKLVEQAGGDSDEVGGVRSGGTGLAA